MRPAQRQRHMQRVTWVSTGVDLLLALIKLAVGLGARSPALIADGLHSLSDLITDVLILAINRWSHAAPDSNHPWGHARFETVGTLLISLALLGVAGGLVWDNSARIIQGEHMAQASPWALAAAGLSLLSKEALYRYGRHWAQRLDSDLLLANAWHSRSDALSSLVVLGGVLATWFGHAWLESWAALLVALLIARMGFALGWDALQQLADRGLPSGQQHAVLSALRQVPGVLSVRRLRSRRMANQWLLDVHIQVAAQLTVSEGHHIAERAIQQLQLQFPELAEISVHVDPDAEDRHNHRPLPPDRAAIELALQRYPALAACDSFKIHYRGKRVILELYFNGIPDAECHAQRLSALAAYDWLKEIQFLQHHRS